MSPGSLQLVHKIILGQFQLKIRSELWSLQPVMKCLFPHLLLCCSSRQPMLPSMSYSMIEVSCPPESIVFTLHYYLSPFSFHPTLSALHVLLFACAFWKYIPFKGPINNCGHNMRDNRMICSLDNVCNTCNKKAAQAHEAALQHIFQSLFEG